MFIICGHAYLPLVAFQRTRYPPTRMPTQPFNTSQRCGALHCIIFWERKSDLVPRPLLWNPPPPEQNVGQPLRSLRNSKQQSNPTRDCHPECPPLFECSFTTFDIPWHVLLLNFTHLCHRWRETTTSCPNLWALIHLQPPPFSWRDRRPPIGHLYLTRLLLRTHISESHEDVESRGVWPRWIIQDIFKTHRPIPSPIMRVHDRSPSWTLASPSTRNPLPYTLRIAKPRHPWATVAPPPLTIF